MLDKMKTKKDTAKNFIRVNDEANDSGSDDEPGENLSHFYSSQLSTSTYACFIVLQWCTDLLNTVSWEISI